MDQELLGQLLEDANKAGNIVFGLVAGSGTNMLDEMSDVQKIAAAVSMLSNVLPNLIGENLQEARRSSS